MFKAALFAYGQRLGCVTLGLPAAIFRYCAITAASIILRHSLVIGQAMS
jgi:hypothetical protein